MLWLPLVAAAALLLPLGVTPAVAAATPTVLTPAGAALLAHAVSSDPRTGEVFQADPTHSTLHVYAPDGHGGLTRTQTVPVGAGPVATVFDPASGHVLTADRSAGTVTTLARSGNGSWSSLGSTPVGFSPAVVAVEPSTGVVHVAGAPDAHGNGPCATLTPNHRTGSGAGGSQSTGAGAGKVTSPSVPSSMPGSWAPTSWSGYTLSSGKGYIALTNAATNTEYCFGTCTNVAVGHAGVEGVNGGNGSNGGTAYCIGTCTNLATGGTARAPRAVAAATVGPPTAWGCAATSPAAAPGLPRAGPAR